MTLTTNDMLEFTVKQTYLGQLCYNVWTYKISDKVGPANAVQFGEAWWNHVKLAYRGMFTTADTSVFSTVVVRELNNPEGEYAEFDIPVGERDGTRGATGLDRLPPHNAVGVRLAVASRLTRPCQKRFVGLGEADQANGLLLAAFRTLVANLMNVAVPPEITLGAPSEFNKLQPIVTRRSPTGVVTASQVITGYVINADITSQNSRKFKRGS